MARNESLEYHRVNYRDWYSKNEKKKNTYNKTWYNKNRDTPRWQYNIYKNGAKRRDIPFELSLKEFEALWQKDCKYCGVKISTIGLDRVTNSQGYTILNVVPCCWDCNRAKGDHFTYEEMISIVGPAISRVRSLRVSNADTKTS